MFSLQKILLPFGLACLALGLISMLTGCDVTEVTPRTQVAATDTTGGKIPGWPAVARPWSVCAAGKAPAPTCQNCTQNPFSWSYAYRTSRHDTVEVFGTGDTCVSLGSLPDTLQIWTLSIGRSGRLDSIWFKTIGDSTHYKVLWEGHRMAPDLFRHTIDSLAGSV